MQKCKIALGTYQNHTWNKMINITDRKMNELEIFTWKSIISVLQQQAQAIIIRARPDGDQ